MTRGLTAAIALLAAFGATFADAQDRGPPRGERTASGSAGRMALNANPSALIAAEFAIYRLAKEEGLWKALRETAAPDAVMFVPDRVNAEDWLKGQKGIAAPIRLDPGQVWMSCDGSYGVVEGAWRQESASGRFLTVWQRQEKKGEYKWILDYRAKPEAQSIPDDIPEMIGARVADCPGRQGAPVPQIASEDEGFGASKDRSLYWREFYLPDGSWQFALHAWDGTAHQLVLGFGNTRPGE